MRDKSYIRDEILKEIGPAEQLKSKIICIMIKEGLSWRSLSRVMEISDGTIRVLVRVNFDASVCTMKVLLKIKKFLDSRIV
jgi:hypothetical protein